jgi:hypothetical protein
MRSRRFVLKTGAAALLVGGAVWGATRAPRRAREPWARAGIGFGDVRLDALSYAILAPNPHNMQPWRVRLEGDDRITLYCDARRLLPETDPPGRQITIGFGCFLELLRQAAANKGYELDVAAFPEGEPQPTLDARPIAKAAFVPSEAVLPDPLFAATLERRTNRAPFSARPVDPAHIDDILSAGGAGVVGAGSADERRIAPLRDLARDAWRIEWGLDRTRRESLAVTRIGRAEIERDPWGLSLSGLLIEAMSGIGILTKAQMDRPGKTAYAQALRFYETAIGTARAFIWTSTETNSRMDQLNAGGAWVRMQQRAAQLGIAFHPLSQALQEFPEMAPAYDRAHELLAHRPGATVQMLARLGYAPSPPPAPREPLTSHLIPA